MDSLSVTLAALADPTRRALLERLARGEASVNDLAAPFELTQQAISKHVAVLERARLLSKRREGRQHVCALSPQPFVEVVAWIDDTRGFWNECFERLEALAQQIRREEPCRGRKR